MTSPLPNGMRPKKRTVKFGRRMKPQGFTQKEFFKRTLLMSWEKENPEEYKKWLESDDYKQWLEDEKNNRYSAIIPPGGPPMNKEEREIHQALIGTPIRDKYGRLLTWAGPIGPIPDESNETMTDQNASSVDDRAVVDGDYESTGTKVRGESTE